MRATDLPDHMFGRLAQEVLDWIALPLGCAGARVAVPRRDPREPPLLLETIVQCSTALVDCAQDVAPDANEAVESLNIKPGSSLWAPFHRSTILLVLSRHGDKLLPPDNS